MSKTILILGGTKEALALAAILVEEGNNVTTSLAGRTREPAPVKGNQRMGGFGGAEGLAAYLRDNAIDLLIDATHPFATQISANARQASSITSIPLEVHTRPPWQKQSGDDWIEVSSLEESRNAIPANARVLLALGSQYIALFADRNDAHFIVRMVDEPDNPLPLADHELVLGKPGNLAEESTLLQSRAVTHIVCRNSGGTGAYAKIKAARELGLPVIIVQRPA